MHTSYASTLAKTFCVYTTAVSQAKIWPFKLNKAPTPLLPSTAVRSKAVVPLLFIQCYPYCLWGIVLDPSFVMQYSPVLSCLAIVSMGMRAC